MTSDRFVTFECRESTCVAVLSQPASPPSPPDAGVVVIVGGPQYRVGSHRQFVLLARALAAAGIPVLRFDCRGMGDSEGEARTFEAIDDDIRAAIDAFVRETAVTRVVLWGLCDGATAAFMYAPSDARVRALVALNPWARSTQGEAAVRLKRYYLQRLGTLAFWRKVVAGKFDAGASAAGLAAHVRNAVKRAAPATAGSFLQRMEDGWRRFRRPTLVLLSGNDLTAREFEAWVASDRGRRELLAEPLTQGVSLRDADHTFSDRAARDAVAAKTVEWISRLQ